MPKGKARRAIADAPEQPAETTVDEPAPQDEVTTEAAETDETVGDETVAEPAELPRDDEDHGGRVVFAERKRAGRRAPLVIAVAAAVFVAAGGFAGATLQPYLADRAAVAVKLDIARTAAEAITTLWTYNPDNMESLGDRAARFLGGDFAQQYRQYIDAIAPTNKQAQVTNNTQVVGAAVESLNGSDATAIVYTNTTSTSPLTKNVPALRYLSYRLSLTRHGSKWLVTKMSTITSLDLTPRL